MKVLCNLHSCSRAISTMATLQSLQRRRNQGRTCMAKVAIDLVCTVRTHREKPDGPLVRLKIVTQ